MKTEKKETRVEQMILIYWSFNHPYITIIFHNMKTNFHTHSNEVNILVNLCIWKHLPKLNFVFNANVKCNESGHHFPEL